MTAVMHTSHAHHEQHPHERSGPRRDRKSLDQKREELDRVEKQLARARTNLARLKRYWSELEDDQRDELFDRLDFRDRLLAGKTGSRAVSARKPLRRTVKKKIIVGNTSSFIPEDHREATDQFTHKWMIYVRGPKEEPDLSWVKKVRITIHPSFAPNDVVDLHHPPFHLSRRGYGEFPAKVQLFLFDPRAAPIEISHNLTLDKELTGKQVIGPETVVEVEIDESALKYNRHTKTSSSVVSPPSAKRRKSVEGEAVAVTDTAAAAVVVAHPQGTASPMANAQAAAQTSRIGSGISTPSRPPRPPVTAAASGTVSPTTPRSARTPTSSEIIIPSHPCMKYDNRLRREMTEEEKMIHEAATKYPLIVVDGNAPYLCAKSNDEFMSWTIGKRKACERFRALYVQKYVKAKYDRDVKVVDICRFCRLAGLSPVVVQNDGLDFLLSHDDSDGEGEEEEEAVAETTEESEEIESGSDVDMVSRDENAGR